MNLTKTLECDGVTITLRRLTWGDDINYNIMVRKLVKLLPPDYAEDEYWGQKSAAYAAALKIAAHTQAVKGIKVALPEATMTPEQIVDACEKLMSTISKELSDEWYSAAESLELPLNDPELAPPDKLTDDQRADPLPQPAE